MTGNDASHQPDHRTESPEEPAPISSPPFDFSSLLQPVIAQWRLVADIGVLLLLLSLVAALLILRPSYTASVQLERYESPLGSDSFRPQAITTAALFALIAAPEAMQKIGAKLTPPLSAKQLAGRLRLTDDTNSGLITVAATGRTAKEAVTLANRFSLDTARSTQTMQKSEAVEAGRLVARQLASNEADRASVRSHLAAIESVRAAARQKEQDLRLSASAPSVAKVDSANLTRLEEKTRAARDTLADLQARYTDAHPLVREQKARLTVLETELRQEITADHRVVATPADNLPPENTAVAADQSTGYDALALNLGRYETLQTELVARQRAIEIFATHPPGYLRLTHEASAENVAAQYNRLNIAMLALLGGALGILGTIIAILIGELLDSRLKTGADLERVTGLPLLATLGNLDTMSPTHRANWAFRTWTALQHKLSVSANHGLVCGFASSSHGEGRSTWIDLLAQAARQCGFRVLTISAPTKGTPGRPAPTAVAPGLNLVPVATNTFANIVQHTPEQLVEFLTVPDPVTKIDLPYPGGWARDRENRKEWERALTAWRAIESIVILVELPPVADPEAVLLAQSLPNLIWLAQSHRAEAGETLLQLETLRNGRCHLRGAVLNQDRAVAAKRRFTRWFGRRTSLVAAAFSMMGAPATAQLHPAADSSSPAQVALARPDMPPRAAWQQRLTLGPGDLLNLSMFGQPELTQTLVPVGPDGRVSYLEAENVMAAGLTVDEFRTALNTALSQFRRTPEVVVSPAAYRSKKFYVMGSVVKKGAFILDRPMTVLEAVSLAQGFAPVPAGRNEAVSADLSQSFLSRDGKHVPVDFAKLFLNGDLSQNVPLEPGDYLYFPAGDPEEVFVLGEVRLPGPVPFTAQTTSLEAIAVRGGFTNRAWRGRLLVIRGALDHPQTFVINARDVLTAKTRDFTLQPHDIIYVSHRPFVRGEELLDTAISSFLQSVVVTATGRYIYNSEVLPVSSP